VKKILILSANPRRTRHLRLDEEIRDIEEAICRSIGRSQYEIRLRLAVRSEDIRRALLEEKPQIVHFCGHGEANGNLLLEDIGGQKKPVTPDALAKLFELCAEYVECVLVNACFSEKASEAISQYIDYSIGMNQAIGEKSTIKFATGFYDAIGAKKSIEMAYKFGINAIQLENLPGVQIPV
jgi:CHAT domain